MEQLDQPGSIKLEKADALAGLPEEVQNEPLGPMIGVAAIALNMAMKYHDFATIQDGVLYQQYKMEGRNMVPIGLATVFDTAIQIERHLIDGNKRVAALMVAATLREIEDEDGKPEPSEKQPPGAATDSAS